MAERSDAQELGRVIRQARESLGLTQDELARALRVSRTAVNHWEKGIRTPDLATLRRLRRLLGLPYEAILGGDDEVKGTNEIPEIPPEEKLRRIGMTLRGWGLREHEVDYMLKVIQQRQEERKREQEQRSAT